MRLLGPAEIHGRLPEIHGMVHSAYPEFINHDHIAKTNWASLYGDFLEYQLILQDKEKIVAVGNSIPLFVDDFTDFPSQGWDWALELGVRQHELKIKPNQLIGLSIAVNPDYAGQCISETILLKFKALAAQHNFEKVLIPIRPTLKHLYPLTEFAEYSNLKSKDGHFDPWIRIHERIGGKRICVCHNSMRITGSVAEWENWTQLRFPISGEYHIGGGLVPLTIDLEQNIGRYVEPNIWYTHQAEE